MLARIYGAIGEDTQNDGWLYEFSWQEDWRFTRPRHRLAPIKLRFEATTHESETDEKKYRKVQELITLANQTTEDRFVEVIGTAVRPRAIHPLRRRAGVPWRHRRLPRRRRG